MDEFDKMLQLYPEIILISKNPPIWKGLLTVIVNDTNYKIKVKVKLVVPLFPQLDNALIQFGGNIAYLFGKKFQDKIESIIKKSESVVCFFEELTFIIKNWIGEIQDKELCNDSFQLDAREKLLKELQNVLSEYSYVDFSSTKNLNTIKLTMNDVSITVKPTINTAGKNSWKILSSDLPEIPGFNKNKKKILSLKEIGNTFQKQVVTLENVWRELQKIDNFCCVTDPIDPKPYHLHRRIYLSPLISCMVTLNPLDPTGYPMLKFLGAEDEVEKFRDIVQDESCLENWDVEYSVYENLLTLLKFDEFPQVSRVDKSEEEEGMVSNEECCICFSMEIEGSRIPDEICINEKCRRHFHSICLFQWLQELATNKIVFNKIFGPCPNCSEEISCNIPSN